MLLPLGKQEPGMDAKREQDGAGAQHSSEALQTDIPDQHLPPSVKHTDLTRTAHRSLSETPLQFCSNFRSLSQDQMCLVTNLLMSIVFLVLYLHNLSKQNLNR